MASGNDIRAAQETYGGFLVFLKWGAVVAAAAAALVVVLIA